MKRRGRNRSPETRIKARSQPVVGHRYRSTGTSVTCWDFSCVDVPVCKTLGLCRLCSLFSIKAGQVELKADVVAIYEEPPNASS